MLIRLSALLRIPATRHRCPLCLFPSTHYWMLQPVLSCRKMKSKASGLETHLLSTDDTIMYTENPKEPTKKRLESVSSANLQGTKSICKTQLNFYTLTTNNSKMKWRKNSIYDSIKNNKIQRKKCKTYTLKTTKRFLKKSEASINGETSLVHESEGLNTVKILTFANSSTEPMSSPSKSQLAFFFPLQELKSWS